MKLSVNQQMGLKNYKAVLLLISVLFVFSCKKEKIDEGNSLGIKVTVKGIEDYIDVDINPRKASRSDIHAKVSSPISSYDGFDAITNIQPSMPVNVENNNDSLSFQKKASNKAVTTTALSDSVRYRLIVVNTSNNAIAINEVIKVGTSPDLLHLTSGVTYKWIAFSINRSTVPNIDLATKTIRKRDLVNTDFLFTSDTFTPSQGANEINIVFKRFSTQYVVNVDVRGMFATLNNTTKATLVNSSTNLFTTADFNVISETFSNDSTISFQGSQMVPTTTFQDQKTVRFHSINTSPSSANTLRLNFSPLSLTMDDNRTREFATTGINFTNHAAITGGTRGMRYTITAKLVESAIIVQGDATNTQWARANLWYSAGNATGAYRLRVSPHFRDFTKNTNGFIADEKDLWVFNGITPTQPSSQANFDPCNSVYPNGLWKKPSSVQFQNMYTAVNPGKEFFLLNNNDKDETLILLQAIRELLLLIGVDLAVLPIYNLEYMAKWSKVTQVPPATNSPYDNPYRDNTTGADPNSTMNDLFLSGIGYKESNGNIKDRPKFVGLLNANALNIIQAGLLGGLSGGGFYWTSDNGTLSSRGRYFNFTYRDGSLASIDLLSLLSLSLLSYNNVSFSIDDFSKDNRLNIRCVRNPSYVPTFN